MQAHGRLVVPGVREVALVGGLRCLGVLLGTWDRVVGAAVVVGVVRPLPLPVAALGEPGHDDAEVPEPAASGPALGVGGRGCVLGPVLAGVLGESGRTLVLG